MSVNNLKYSKAGAELTKSFESCKLVAYHGEKDPPDVWTIAWGHTRGVKPGMTCTPEQADAWLAEDYAICEADVNAHVTVPLTQGEFDALVDFAFNLGDGSLNGSTLLKDLNAGNYHAAAAEFEKWDHAGGHVVAGLLRRRLAEEQEFIPIDPEISN
jgi:lysozyme